ncbi:MAG TPA: adenylate/guanylate cyclase domain-containing protein [Aeromicrobium sp.]|nr:adenylate/guanylate cyclase domain-containing protein [Aeromicrobium sp.]
MGAGSYPLPEDPVLGAMAAALSDAGYWADIVDKDWRLVYTTDDQRLSTGDLRRLVDVGIGEHFFGESCVNLRLTWEAGFNTVGLQREFFAAAGGLTLADTPGGRAQLREQVHPELSDLVDELSPDHAQAGSRAWHSRGISGTPVALWLTALRLYDETGRLAGTAMIYKPAASMTVLGAVAGAGDLRHFEQMQLVRAPARRPAAILFADLEGSSPLSKRLSTASYFALGRRLVRAADQCIIDEGGLVGRHVGDGVVGFFLAESAGSESAAAKACIRAARRLRSAVADVALRSGLEPSEVVLRFGLHWGSTLYVGNITSGGRSEVTALGDEVNEAARIEACATGGRALASKNLIERLDADDAKELDLNPDRVHYIQLSELPTASEKARRDAAGIAVCEI